jgi:ribosomal protein L24
MKLNIKKNDQVLVTAGKNRGARGRVLRVLSAKSAPGEPAKAPKAIVERAQ